MNLSQDYPLPRRHNPSPGVHIQFGQSNIVLLTINTEKREPWLANPRAHRLLHESWLEATAWLVGDYLLMPDHLHLFCAPRDLHFTVETWISYWKREFALKQKRLAGTPAPPEWKFQPRGWHHRLRDGGKLFGEVALRTGESCTQRVDSTNRGLAVQGPCVRFNLEWKVTLPDGSSVASPHQGSPSRIPPIDLSRRFC